MGEPEPEWPDRGRIEFSVDCAAAAGFGLSARAGAELAEELAAAMAKAVADAGAFDLCAAAFFRPHRWRAHCRCPGRSWW